MPKLKKKTAEQRKFYQREKRRENRKEKREFEDGLNSEKSVDGLNFPKKCDGLNFPKKCDGLNFPKKCDGLNFPKKSKSADNGLNFPKKSKSSENGLNFPKKAKNADNGLNFPKKANGANIVAHSAPTVAHSVLTAAYSVPTAGYSVSTAGYSVPSVANSSFPTVAHSVAEEHDSEYFANGEAESCDRFTKAFVNEDFNKQIDFDEVFADSFPNVVAHANSQIDNDDETEELNISSVDINVHNATQESTSSSLWNASHIIYGSFHQNDDRFSELSRGFQCTCNAICMLAYMTVNEIHNSSSLDEILHDGDSLYKKVVSDLKAQKKFSHALLSLDEMPECFKTKTQDFFITKQPILSGVLVQNFEERGLPTLHCALESALTQVSSVLLTVGAICSAVVKHNDRYMFFDSHSHGEDCLSASDGSSILIDFPSLEDLISYLYALYDSMSIDTSLQFDLLPLTVRQNEQLSSNTTQSGNLLEAYFRDQNLRQQEKAHLNTDKSTSAKKKNSRKMYFKLFKSKARLNPYFKAKERAEKQKARQKPGVLAKEKAKKQEDRQKADFKASEIIHQRASKQNARQRPGVLAKERADKQEARQKPGVLEKEKVKKQKDRQRPGVLAKEKAKKQEDRQKADFKASEIIHQRASKQNARQKPGVLEKEKAKKQEDRQKADFKTSEIIHQRASKQNARQRPGVLAKERADKQEARQNSVFKANEVKYQRKSKQKARSNPFVLECERVKKQETRQQKQKLEAAHTVPNLCASSGTLQKQASHQPVESIEECIKQFHLSISVGPLFVCTCCHQTWFRKSCSMLKNTHIPASSIRLYCTNLHSVHDEEWVCHTCLGALRESKVPRLSVANGMKWPEKPPELNLHQLEERLLALRIPFMQIRELPRGGQYSVKGNVINVPVDIQPTVKSLPRPMDENFTIAVQLKKKMAYKKVDFKENVRPLKVLAALHWLVNNSEFYKKFGFDIDENWYQNVTESAEDAVREFLDVPEQPNTSVSKENQEIEVDAATTSSSFKDCAVNDNYDSDEFSEIDANETVGNIDTLVDDANIENKYDQVFTFAPGEGQHPLSLYQDTDAEYLCFPSIFCGQRRPLNDERVVPVHYSDIVKWELRSVDRRAAQSVPNIFFKHKRLQMKQISDKVNLAVRRCKSKGKTITAAEARSPAYLDKLVNLDEGYYIFRQLRNSPAYLAARKKDIFAMIRQLGLPTWFMSLSAADTRWIDLLKMLAKLNDGIELKDKDIESLTWQEKTRLVQKDPVTCSRYFDHRVQEFLNIILKSTSEPIGKLKDFFYRVEFQQRGSPHIHMLVWVENAPFLEKNSEEEIVQFVDQYLTCSAENKETVHLVELQTHKHSRTCRKKGKAVCRFGFPLPPLPKTMLLYPLEENVEHYQKKYKELQKAMNEYKDDGEITFNDFLIEVAQMDFESYVKCIRSSLKVPKVFLKRKPSEMRVNMYNGNILLAWKANLDIQIVIEPYGCAAYVVGYISKSQRGMSAQLDAAAKEARNGNLNLKKQVRHIGNVFSNAVEVSAQEAVYLALQIPLTKCTRDVVFINTSTPEERVFLLKPKAILDELPAESKDIESDSVIQRYSKRPRQLQKLCLADYVSKVDVIYPKGNKLPERIEDKNDDSGRESDSSDETEDSDVELKYDHENPRPDLLCKTKNGTKYKYRKVPRVIRYVKYNRTKDPENYHREQLMLFMPWRNEQKDLLGPFETYTAHHDSMKALLEQKRNEYEHHTEELELARQMMEAEEASYDRLAPNAEQENREAQEEGVKDAEDFVYFNPERVTEHRHYDIGIEIQCTSSVQTEETTGFMMPDEEYLSLLRSLNLRQREFFNHVIHWMKCRDEPLYAFLSGGAGVGKSVVIRALYQCLYRILNMREGENPDETRILLCAYMGIAAYNINGKTIASAFHKKMFQSNQVMTADELNTFRIKYRHLKVVIIDEISMVGTRTLDFIDTRLQQLTGTRINFGGLSVIAVGDLYQLKPVGDPPLYVGLTEGASALAPNLWKEYFKMYELVDIMRQKDDLEFAHLLNRLRLNELTDTDLQTLHGRFVDQLDNYPKDALHIFAENSFVDEHNENVLNHLTEEKVIVQCHDTVVSSNIPQTECRNLIRKLPDVVSKTGNLQKNLTVAVGMIYVMTVNVYVEDGLTNGSTGVVKYIEYKMEGTNRPSVIWMLFDDPQIGKLTRQKYLQRGFYHSNIRQEWTPVFDVERTFMYKYKMYQRIQFPLRAAAAKTVHKAQGATVDQVVVDLSQTQTRRIPHIHYVALSRVKKLENLYIVNLNEATITLDEKVTEEMDRLRTNAVLELCYTPLYKIKPCKAKFAFNNTRSLHKHFQEIQFEPNILASDVVGFAETRLCARDEDMHFALNRFRLIRFDETACQSISRPHHGLAVYIKQNIEIEKIVKHRSHSCEFIMAALNSTTKGFYQYVVVYKYPKSSQADLKKDICSHLRPVVDISSKLVIMGDFNIQVNDLNCQFVKFMENTFQCHQNIKQPTTDAGSILDLIFSNDQVYSDTVEAYWTDHKLVYCVVD